MKFSIDDKDPIWGQARQVMLDIDHGRISGQAAFSKLIGLYAGTLIGQAQKFEASAAAELAKLGPTAQPRVTAVQTFLRGHLGDEAAGKMNAMLVTADIVKGFEALMAKFVNQGAAPISQGGRVTGDGTGEIPGYDKMSFEQRRHAQDALRRKTG